MIAANISGIWKLYCAFITWKPTPLGGGGEGDVLARMELREVSAAVANLSDDQREVLVLVCVEDFSYRDAAELLQLPIGTVMSRLARARKNLAAASGITEGKGRCSDEKG